MRLMIIVLLSLTMLFSEGIQEKLIVSGDTDILHAQENLLKLKVYFLENPETRILQEKHKLKFEMDDLGDYKMVVIRPIGSLVLKNELMLLLSPEFPDIFCIEDKKIEVKSLKIDKGSVDIQKPALSSKNERSAQYKFWLEKVGLQWLTLLLLAITGLTLSIRSRRRLANLEKTQKDLSIKQDKIEDDIKHLGVGGV